MMIKGRNPQTGGYSKAILDSMSPDERKNYLDSGLLLDGSEPSFPYVAPNGESKLEENPQVKSDPPEEISKEPMISLSEVEKLLDKKKAEWDAEKAAEQKQTAPVIQTSYGKFDSIDDIGQELEYKDRIFKLKYSGKVPAYRNVRNRPKKGSPLNWTHPVTKKTHPLRICIDHPSIFKDVQGDSPVTLMYPAFINGWLKVSKDNIPLQNLMAIHPDRGVKWDEHDEKIQAAKEYEFMELEADAIAKSREVEYVVLEAAARMMLPGFKESWEPTEVKKSLYPEIKKYPQKFLNLVSDPSIKIKGIVKMAMGRGLLQYSNGRFLDEKGRALDLEVGRNENEIEVFAKWTKTTNAGRDFYDKLISDLT